MAATYDTHEAECALVYGATPLVANPPMFAGLDAAGRTMIRAPRFREFESRTGGQAQREFAKEAKDAIRPKADVLYSH